MVIELLLHATCKASDTCRLHNKPPRLVIMYSVKTGDTRLNTIEQTAGPSARLTAKTLLLTQGGRGRREQGWFAEGRRILSNLPAVMGPEERAGLAASKAHE